MKQFLIQLSLMLLVSAQNVVLFAQSNDWTWSYAGPIYTAGRARNIVVDHKDPSGKTLYAGSVSSGIFKSVDGGARWIPMDDQGKVRNISFMAQSHDGTIYAGTGEGFLRLSQKEKAQTGTGLYKLMGTTLVQVESSATIGTIIHRIACHPTLSHIAVATNKGIFISMNGSAYTPVNGISTGSLTMGMDVKFNNAGILYCTVGNETGVNVGGANTTTISGKLYRSTDATLSNFIDITPVSSVLPDANYGRMELAIAPSNNNVMYVLCANKNKSIPTDIKSASATLKGLFVTYDATLINPNWGLVKQFSAQLDPSFNGDTIASADYAQAILVNPTNPDQLYIGSYSLNVYTRTGGSNSSPIGMWERWGQSADPQKQTYLHEYIHDIKIVPGNPLKYYFVTDAGIFRSLDMANANQFLTPTFQPFYKGLATGQFNSVSIERFPLADSTNETKPGTKIKPYSGFIGGTAGNGLNYYSGKDTLVSKELNYLSTEVYNAEYSKILNGAAFLSIGSGNIYRTTNVRTTAPTIVSINTYTGALAKITPVSKRMANTKFSEGTPFRLWENYGQKNAVADSVIFYNDSARTFAATMTFNELTTKTNFTFSIGRPNGNRSALIDSIVVRTATVIPSTVNTPINIPFTTAQSIAIALPKTYSLAPTNTRVVMTGTNITVKGPVSSVVQPSITLNSQSLKDEISVTFASAPFANKTQTSSTINNALYYAVIATVFYKYKAGDTLIYEDNTSISTKTFTYATVLTKPLRWSYFGALPVYTLTAPIDPAIPNPTFILTPGNVTQSTPIFTVQPMIKTNYVITQTGSYSPPLLPLTYSISAVPLVNYTIMAVPANTVNPLSCTLGAVPNSAITNASYAINPPGIGPSTGVNPVFTVSPSSPTNYTITQTGVGSPSVSYTYFNSVGGYTYVLNPGNILQTSPKFVVSPSALTMYTITQSGSTATLAPSTYSSVGTTTYVLHPGAIVQSHPTFVVTPTITTTYTLSTVSSNTLSAPNTTTLFTFLSARTNSNGIGTTTSVPFSPVNPYVRIPTLLSARLAFVLNNSENTLNKFAIVVSKNPLAMNKPLNVNRVSQSGCYMDDAYGNPTNSVITISGRPTVLEWSKKGTEIYYATDDHKLYRVSHMTDLFDLSSGYYSGKFSTDIFGYETGILNPASPYRTTLIGDFDRQVTSISVSNDDKNLVITFSAVNSGTTGLVLYNTNNAQVSDFTNIGWVDKTSSLTNSFTTSYCSLMEKEDSKKVFIGTDNGLYYTSDITSAAWTNVNTLAGSSGLPNVQILDIDQQILDGWDCYNSGQIYVATNGRGVWMNKTFFTPYAVGIDEERGIGKDNRTLLIYPNPANGIVTLDFNAIDGEDITIHVMDMSGRLLKKEHMGKLSSGEMQHTLNLSDLTTGVYIIQLTSSSNIKRVSKMVLSK